MEQITLPDEIGDLSEAVIDGVDCSDCYVEKEDDGSNRKDTKRRGRAGFVLSDAARREVAMCNEDLAKQHADAATKLAERDRQIERLNHRVQDMAASGAVRAALYQCGVTGKPINLALPYLVKKLAPEIADDGSAVVSDTFGRQTVESAVSRWLTTSEGQRFAPRPQVAQGRYATAVRAMRRGT